MNFPELQILDTHSVGRECTFCSACFTLLLCLVYILNKKNTILCFFKLTEEKCQGLRKKLEDVARIGAEAWRCCCMLLLKREPGAKPLDA